ncbi:MAG: hypothetical protein IT436_16025 [Phycisphaerales bacterium]|nr:hypothetical protein [Phycisphaerales bacterium]
MNRAELPRLVRDLIYARQHGLLDDDVGRAAARAVLAGVGDSFVERLIGDRVFWGKVRGAMSGGFDLPRLGNGEVLLGRDLRGRPVRVPLRSLGAHRLTVGGSGSGKTTLALVIALQVALLVEGFWWFDLRKREGARLRPALARAGVELAVLPARLMRINPLQVPIHVAPVEWASRVADLLVQVLELPPRASKLLHVVVLELYEQFGVASGAERYPTLFDLREAVASKAGANPQAREAFLDSIDPVLLSLGPSVLGYRYGWTTRDLAGHRIVFEFGGLADADQNLLLNTLLWSEFTSRIARGASNVPMDLYVALDEGARLARPGASSGIIAEMLGLVRGAGIGLDLSVQAGDLARSVLSNTAVKCLGRCGSAADYDLIGAAMGLTYEQKQWAKHHLEPGVFIGLLGEGGFEDNVRGRAWGQGWRQGRHPFVFSVPRIGAAPEPAPTERTPPVLAPLPALRG